MIGYRLPTHVLIEPGCFQRLPQIAKNFKLSSVLLAIDPGIKATGLHEHAQDLLKEQGISSAVFDEIEANPRTSTTERMGSLLREEGLTGIIGLGGGSVLDAAKAAAMLATNPGEVIRYVGKDQFEKRPLPFIAVPTTCGTGSEVTWVSVLSHPETRTKISVKGLGMFPDQALVDADLLKTLPSHLVASTGVDALTHALESTTCTEANPIADALAENAIDLLFEFLPRAVANVKEDAEARAAVMRGSTIAGTSFGNADVAAVHCLSETIGGLYDVPHGLCNAILLAPTLRYHQPHVDDRLAALQRKKDKMGLAHSPVKDLAHAFLEDLEELVRKLEIPPFSSLKIPKDSYEEIAERSTKNGSNGSNPQVMEVKNYLEILESLD